MDDWAHEGELQIKINLNNDEQDNDETPQQHF